MLADDIGIIDKGILLEEESLAKLEQISGKYIHFTISDTAQAARILEQVFNENGLEVSEAHTCEDSLEEHFKKIIGDEGSAYLQCICTNFDCWVYSF